MTTFKEKILFIAFIVVAGAAFAIGGALSDMAKNTVGVAVPSTAAIQQQAWTTIEAYDNYTGGAHATTDGLANVTIDNSSYGRNTTLYISPADHRLAGKDKIYILRFIRANVSDSSADINITLMHSFNTSGNNFSRVTGTSMTAGNTSKEWDLTTTAGKAPLVFSGNSMVRLDMSASKNVTVKMEILGSQ